MTLERFLETFDPRAAKPRAESAVLNADEIEQIRAAAYEAGYASGWEDATRAETEARQRIGAEFERNVENLAFTYNEAVDRVRGELKSFVAALLDGFFPELVPHLMREHVRSELMRIADEFIESPVELVCSPDSRDIIGELLGGDFGMQIELVEDAGLAARQVFVRIGNREVEVDLAPLLKALQDQFRALLETPEDESDLKEAGHAGHG